ncbi:hypothetical protein C4565_03565 [Candidatus Parcubacteria bacterium]|nr:MAG: hypothetical protein C4565_03565 [Candidatus Parcubacteria bacterium]
MGSRYLSRIKRVLSKPPKVIAFRILQLINLELMALLGVWQRIAKHAEQESVGIENQLRTVLIVAPRPMLSDSQRHELKLSATAVKSSKFVLFSHVVPNLDECDFSTDWRFCKKWQPQYYRRYHFYEDKSEAYDVKFPWELSRFHYLIPVLVWQWIGGVDGDTLRWINRFLSRWRVENPLAYSVNWYPMEASMRIISLVLMLDLVTLLAREASGDLLGEIKILEKHLLTLIIEHGTFVWYNREFTDVRGNHFTANLSALLLASTALSYRGRPRLGWWKYSLGWLDKEILLQFCSDGVNFEKSCGYHKMVLELFLLAAIVREREGVPFSPEARSRLMDAARFSDALTKTNGLAANFGDNDDAIVLPFSLQNSRSHGTVVELARAFFVKAIGSVVFSEIEKLASLFLLGRSGAVMPAVLDTPELMYFPAGGYVVMRQQSNGFFCMIDVGEVGMAGRGGHGHNDLLAFELCMSGFSVVIDPGCSAYTADLGKKTRYRSTASHSTVQLFGEEIARISGHWRILDDAHPLGISVSKDGDSIKIRSGHDGYERIAAGSRVFRSIEWLPKQQRVTVTDEVHVPCDNVGVRWRFPIGNLPVERQSQKELKLGVEPAVIVISDLPLILDEAFFSHGYGHEEPGRVIIAESKVSAGRHVYCFNFYPIKS